MTNLKIKPTIDPNAWMDEPIKADKWRNIYFLKDGTSHVGPNVRSLEDREEQARHVAQRCKDLTKPFYTFRQTGVTFAKKDYSHAIQLPVKS